MPVEIILHILSYLHILDFFPLKLANRYIYNIINSFPHLTFTDYIAELEAEDGRRSGIGQKSHSALAIAASRGQEALVFRLQKIVAKTKFKRICGMTTGHSTLQRVLNRFKWEQYRSACVLSLPDEDGRTPLHWAAESGQTALVRTLVSKRVRIWLTDENTALHLAAQNGHRKVVELLIQKGLKGADVSMANNNGSTPLNIAASRGHLEVVRLLLDKGADVSCHS
jgi:hypothetical protein